MSEILSTEQLIAQGFNFTDLEEVEPLPEPLTHAAVESLTLEFYGRALNVTRCLPQEIQNLITPITDPGPDHDRSEVKCCPLCGAPEDWDD
jgi:hypothetical protein